MENAMERAVYDATEPGTLQQLRRSREAETGGEWRAWVHGKSKLLNEVLVMVIEGKSHWESKRHQSE